MNDLLKKRLIQAASGGAIALAGVLATWYEGRRLTPYRDPVGILTVCEGITGKDVVPGKTYTPAECDALRDKHLRIADAAVSRQIRVPLTPWQRAALIDFTYNLGEEALAGSTLARHFNAGNAQAGCEQLSRWVKARVQGKLVTLRGLVDRRGAELEVCLGQLQEVANAGAGARVGQHRGRSNLAPSGGSARGG